MEMIGAIVIGVMIIMITLYITHDDDNFIK